MPNLVATNIRILQPSRKKLLAGDVFRVGLPDETFVFGRVIQAATDIGPMGPGSNLVYVYRHRSANPEPSRERLIRDELLIPPLFINRLPWSRGYFETVSHEPLTADDVLPKHCFRRSNGTYLDENGQLLPAERHPCGDWGLHSFRSFDDAISDALGLPQVPEPGQLP